MNQNQQLQSMFANPSNQQQQQQQIQNQQQQLNFQNFSQIPMQSSPNFPILSQPTHTNYNIFGGPSQQQPQKQFYAQPNLQPSLFGINNMVIQNQLPINFQDDEKVEPKKEDAKQTSNKYDLNEKLSFEVKTLYKMGKLMNSRTQYLPGIVSIKAQDQTITQNPENQRVGVDLICLIDKSGSMDGQKIAMVQQTLSVLLDFLSDCDRYQLITFESSAQRLTPLKRVTDGNKQYFRQIISQIYSGGGTNIGSATDLAFRQLKERKYRNNVTSIFLLSDGQDGNAVQRISEQIKTVNEVFTLHTFGFGQDHDAPMMTQICNLKSGSFYFVQDVTLLDEFFADALGGLISVVGEQLEITITSQAPPPYQNIQISKTYGNMWQKKGNLYYITQPQFASGSRKDYVFELVLPKFEAKIEDFQRNVKVIDAELKIKDPVNGTVITKQTSLTLTFFNQDEQINQNEADLDVYAQYFRVKGTEVIDEARKACEQNKNEDAEKLIDNMLIQIQKIPNVAAQCTGIIQDLQQAKQASARTSYSLFGQKQMCQMVSNNYQQGGVNSLFSAQGMQLQQVQPAAYQNVQQQQMMFQVQYSKAPQKFN
ncbi:unnamed protein product [Paramecium primaurelia]|uniref:VWFA domain-containing protein n=1 Tax=Paramecium primaurelia TaxID=5886 RepID=A0A8S1QWS0_PARPR|nr:unnamed protein product [Paramecium primaurelia]